MTNKCCICEVSIVGLYKSNWFCKACYASFTEDIQQKKPWVKFLMYEEQKRRRRGFKDSNVISLNGGLFLDNDDNLVGGD